MSYNRSHLELHRKDITNAIAGESRQFFAIRFDYGYTAGNYWYCTYINPPCLAKRKKSFPITSQWRETTLKLYKRWDLSCKVYGGHRYRRLLRNFQIEKGRLPLRKWKCMLSEGESVGESKETTTYLWDCERKVFLKLNNILTSSMVIHLWLICFGRTQSMLFLHVI